MPVACIYDWSWSCGGVSCSPDGSFDCVSVDLECGCEGFAVDWAPSEVEDEAGVSSYGYVHGAGGEFASVYLALVD